MLGLGLLGCAPDVRIPQNLGIQTLSSGFLEEVHVASEP